MWEYPPAPRPAPPVTVVGGPAGSGPDGAAAPVGPAGVLLALAALVLLAVTVAVGRTPPADPVPPLEAALRLADGPLSGSQGGVLLLPVDVTVTGADSRLGDAVLWAEPVRQPTELAGGTRFTAGTTGRVVVLVQPDCTLLAPSQGLSLVLTAELELVGAQGQRVRRVLDLGAEPAVEQQVADLCRAPAEAVR